MQNSPQKLRAPSIRSASEEWVGEHEPDSVPSTAVSAFVLAGGESSRMGSDKALIELAGQPLIARALAALRDAGFEPMIAGARSDLSEFAQVIPDPAPGLGPLSGICAALESTSARFSVFMPVDLPLLPPSLIASLTHRAQIASSAVTLASICGVANTFPAVVDGALLEALKSELGAGRRGCMAAFQTAAAALGRQISVIPIEFLAQSGHVSHARGFPPAFWFWNANTPEDVARVAGYFSPQIA